MNLSELSNLVQVTTHLKTVINSAGYTKFKPETITALKRKLSEFDDLFIQEILNHEVRNDAKMIQDAVREARDKMGTDQKYPHPSYVKQEEERRAREEAMTAQAKHEADLAALKEAAKKPEGSKKVVRRNAAPVVEEVKFVNDDLKTGQKIVEEPAKVETKEEVKQPAKAATPSSAVNQPYAEDESLAALLAAERQKVAAKKRKQ